MLPNSRGIRFCMTVVGIQWLLTAPGVCSDDLKTPPANDSAAIKKILQDAAVTTREISAPLSRASGLREIAVAQARIGQLAIAEGLVKEAIRSTRAATGTFQYDLELDLTFAAKAQAKIGDIRGALETVRTLKQQGPRDVARHRIFRVLLTRKEFAAAAAICENFETGEGRARAFLELLKQMGADGKVNEGIKIANEKIKDAKTRRTAILLMTRSRLEARDVASAERLLPMVEEPESKITLICSIGSGHAEAGNSKAALACYTKAREAAKIELEDSDELLLLQAQVGDVNEVLKAIQGFDHVRKSEIIRRITLSWANQGKFEQALRLMQLDNLDSRAAETRREIAILQAKRGKYRDAIGTAKTILIGFVRPAAQIQFEAFHAIAKAQLAAGDTAGAKGTLAEFAKSIGQFSKSEFQNSLQLFLMSEMAIALVEVGDPGAAQAMSRRASEASKTVPVGPPNRTALARRIAKAQSRCGNLTEAVEAARKFALPEDRAAALLGAAQGQLPDEPADD